MPEHKAAVERSHDIEVLAVDDGWRAQCLTDGCSWVSITYDSAYSEATRQYLAENAASEHRRAVAGWPGTS